MLGPRSFAGAAAIAVVAALVTGAPASADPAPSHEVVGLVVTREPGTSASRAESLVGQALDDADTERSPVAPGITAVAIEGVSRAQALRAAREIESRDGVQRVDLDTRVTIDAAVDDPDFPAQWALTDPVSGVAAVPAWSLTTGEGQVIAVIDTGITSHPDLDAQVLPGFDMVTDSVVANDSDGRDPDASDPGDWVSAQDLIEHPETFAGCQSAPSSWHGTHVAGIAAAVQNNAIGVSGLSAGSQILPVRALGKCGGTMSDVAAAVTWASGGDVPGTAANPTPADVINLSVSSDSVCQPFVQAAIDDARSRGSNVVVSAGNGAGPITEVSPAGCYDLLAVGAVNRSGDRAWYSNFGVDGRDLPIFAPGGVKGSAGTGILSTVNLGTQSPAAPGYEEYYGTSMAAPFVSAAAAMARSVTGQGPAAIDERLRKTVRPFPAFSSCQGSCGAGLLDVDAALRYAPRVPGAPSAVTLSAADSAVIASWEEPADAGSAPVAGYDVQYRRLGGEWTAYGNIWPSTLRQRLIGGLSNGVPYEVRVSARNVFGSGAWATSNSATPLTLPGALQIRSVKYRSKTSARVELRLPFESLTAVQFRLTRRDRTPPEWTTVAPTSRIWLRKLPKGVRHTLDVRAANDLGAGPTATRRIATPVKPGKVRKLRAVRKKAGLRVRWREPLRTGLKPRYRVRVQGVTQWRRTKDTRLTVRRVGAGPWRVQVQSLNEKGKGRIKVILKRK